MHEVHRVGYLAYMAEKCGSVFVFKGFNIIGKREAQGKKQGYKHIQEGIACKAGDTTKRSRYAGSRTRESISDQVINKKSASYANE